MVKHDSEKQHYVKGVVRALKWDMIAMEQSMQQVDPSIKITDIGVCGSLADYLKGDKKRFRTPTDYPKGDYSDIDAVVTFNKPNREVAELWSKTETRCPCVFNLWVGPHALTWNFSDNAPCSKSKQVSVMHR